MVFLQHKEWWRASFFTVNLGADALAGSVRTALCDRAGFGSIVAFPRRPER